MNYVRSSALKRMKPGAGAAPIFIFPGSPGSLSQLAPLVGCLRTAASIYGVEPKGVYPGEDPLERIEDMAEYAIRDIELAARGGPYLLVGYSAGGLVAFEIARRLSSDGANIALLALLDTCPSEKTWPLRCKIEVFVRQFTHRSKQLLIIPRAEITAFIGERFRGIFAYLWRSGLGLRGWQRPATGTMPPAEQRLHHTTIAAVVRYRPSYYDHKITLFKPDEIGMQMQPRDPRSAWGKFARELEIHVVQGTHVSMTCDVEILAARLSACLETAIAAGPSPPPVQHDQVAAQSPVSESIGNNRSQY
jgi:thioesterase domain-containing protein